MEELYESIIEKKNLWNYYNKELDKPDLTDSKSCYKFILNYIKYAEKSETILKNGLDYLNNKEPQRLKHIVSTFILGLSLYHNDKLKIKNRIQEELSFFKYLNNKSKQFINEEFTYLWFMMCLFHDLGYMYEKEESNTTEFFLNPLSEANMGVPSLYKEIFENYFRYRESKDHGILGGIYFYRDMCAIRKFQYHKAGDQSKLYWGEELEEVYNYVAWCILAHNIWFQRDIPKNPYIEIYKENHLEYLILKEQGVLKKGDKNRYYKDYKISFDHYPIFFLFCLVDSIEPLKQTSFLTDIEVEFEKDKIILKSNDTGYISNVSKLNDWLTHVKNTNSNELEINIK